jgi:hypothetical protein
MSNSSKEMPDFHGFLIMGKGKLFSCHLPMFFMPDHSFQVILEVELESTAMATYLKTRNEHPGKPLIIMNNKVDDKGMLLKDIVNSGSFEAKASFANNDGDPIGHPFIESTTVAVNKKLLFEPLNPNTEYPENITYYLYGINSEFHLSHLLSKVPNFQQELDVTVSGDILDKIKESDSGLVKTSIPSLKERSMQPITSDPLTQAEYTIRMDDDGSTGKISIGNKFWINNGPLNQAM